MNFGNFPCAACPLSALCLPQGLLYRSYPVRVAHLIDICFLASITEEGANCRFDLIAPKMRCHSSIDYNRLKEGRRGEEL